MATKQPTEAELLKSKTLLTTDHLSAIEDLQYGAREAIVHGEWQTARERIARIVQHAAWALVEAGVEVK